MQQQYTQFNSNHSICNQPTTATIQGRTKEWELQAVVGEGGEGRRAGGVSWREQLRHLAKFPYSYSMIFAAASK